MQPKLKRPRANLPWIDSKIHYSLAYGLQSDCLLIQPQHLSVPAPVSFRPCQPQFLSAPAPVSPRPSSDQHEPKQSEASSGRDPDRFPDRPDPKNDDSCTFSAHQPTPEHGRDEPGTEPGRSPDGAGTEPGRVRDGARPEAEGQKVRTVLRF